MSKKEYKKSALTIEQQVSLLKTRGLEIDDEEEVKHYLSNVSYYHLSGYFKPFQGKNDLFSNASFRRILDLYFFDRKLRLLFSNAIERIEKSFKTQFIYHLSITYGANCITENSIFEKHRSKIDKNLKESKEPFINDFKEKYSNPYPPLWIVAEVLSFGDILFIFIKSLKTQDKKIIAGYYGLGWKYLYSWLENLREVRNICAHYSRLWNRKITKHLKKGDEYKMLTYNSHIFDSIVVICIILKTVSPTFEWLNEIRSLIKEYDIDCEKMGFPKNWEKIFDELSDPK